MSVDVIEGISFIAGKVANMASGGFVGIAVGGLVGGAFGFSVSKLENANQDVEILVTLTGILIGGCATRLMGGNKKHQAVEDNKLLSDPPLQDDKTKALFLDLKKNVFTKAQEVSTKLLAKATDGVVNSIAKNPEQILTMTALSFNSLSTKIASITSNIHITGVMSETACSDVIVSASHAVVAAAILGTLGYMAYNYIEKEHKNTEIRRENLTKEEEKLENSYKKLEEMVSNLSNETQNKELHSLHTKFMDEYLHGEIKVATVNDISFKYNEILGEQKKPICKKVTELGNNILDSISRCHSLRDGKKGFVEKFVVSGGAPKATYQSI